MEQASRNPTAPNDVGSKIIALVMCLGVIVVLVVVVGIKIHKRYSSTTQYDKLKAELQMEYGSMYKMASTKQNKK